MITTQQIEIPKTDNLCSEYIESALSKFGSKGIVPLRWAIVDVTRDNYVVSVSYEK